MEFKEENQPVAEAKPLASQRQASRRGAHWKKFDFGKDQGVKVWQAMQISGNKPAAD